MLYRIIRFVLGIQRESATVAQARARAAQRRAARLLPECRSEWEANQALGGAR